MQYDYKECDFYTYCNKCKHKDKRDIEDPCNDCLGEPCNLHSTKPVYFEAEGSDVYETYRN